jgi:hypothetical protein
LQCDDELHVYGGRHGRRFLCFPSSMHRGVQEAKRSLQMRPSHCDLQTGARPIDRAEHVNRILKRRVISMTKRWYQATAGGGSSLEACKSTCSKDSYTCNRTAMSCIPAPPGSGESKAICQAGCGGPPKPPPPPPKPPPKPHPSPPTPPPTSLCVVIPHGLLRSAYSPCFSAIHATKQRR